MSRADVKIVAGNGRPARNPAPYTSDVRQRLLNESRGAIGHFLVTVRAGDVRSVIHAADARQDEEITLRLEIRRLRGENAVLREHIAVGAKLLGDHR